MAEKSLIIRILGDAAGLQTGLSKAEKSLAALGGGLLLFGKTAVSASIESDKAIAQLGNTIQATGRTTAGLQEGILNLSTEIEHYSGVSDEAVTGAQTMLLQFENIGDEAIPRATRAITDMATSMNGGATPSADQLREAAVKVGKALNLTAGDTEGVSKAIRGLTSEGIRFTQSQQDILKSMVETGKISEAQTMILERMEARWKGAAEAAGKTFGGQIEIARQKADDFNEDAGKLIQEVLGPLMRDFPAVTTAIVGTADAWGKLNISTGDLLIAGPKLIEMAGGLAVALGLLGQAVAAAGVGFAAWNIGRMIGEIQLFGTSIDDLTKSLFEMTTFAHQNAVSLKENEIAINRIAGLLKTPIVRQAGEDWKTYADRVIEAARNEATAATHQAQLSTVMEKGTSTVKSHVISLAQQIEKQKALIATLSTQVGKDKELTEATDKLTQLLKKQAEPTEKAKKEMEGYGSALGVTIPRLKEVVTNGEKYLAYLKKSGASTAELKEAELKLRDARLALLKATTPLLQETEAFIKATEHLDKVQLDNAETHKAAAENARQLTEEMKALGIIVGTELPADFGKPKTALLDLEASFKTLGITSSKALQQQAVEARAAYESIRDSGQASARDIALAWADMTQKEIDVTREAGGKISYESQRAVDAIKSKYGELKNDNNANLTTWRELASKQVSTLVSDVSKGFADILVSGGSFGSKIIAMFKNIGKGMLQAFFESGIGGLLSGKGFGGFSGFGQGLLDSIKGLFGNKGGLPQLAGIGGLGSIPLGGIAGPGAPEYPGGPPVGGTGGAFGGGLGTLADLLGPITLGGGLGATVLGNKLGGGIAGSIGGAAIGGLGSALGATALVSGLGAGGGFGSAIAGMSGLLGAIPVWGWAALGAAIAAGPIINKLTQRGRDKTTATGSAADPNNLSGAEGLSYQVWQQIIPAVKAGNLSIAQGEAAVKEAWANYEAFLHANVKDQVVVQRSLDTQKVTLTQSLAELEEMKKGVGTEGLENVKSFLDEMAKTGQVSDDAIAGMKALVQQMEGAGQVAETSAAKLGLLGAEFFKTGQMTNEFQTALEGAGGSGSFFTRMTGQIQQLQGLRAEFGGLKQLIDSLIPASVTKTWQQEFFETGVISAEMEKKIKAAGGSIVEFKKFADLRQTKVRFQELVDEFMKTGIASQELLAMIKEFGGEDAVKAFEDLRAEAEKSGKTIGELAQDSQDSAKIIQTAFDTTGAGIDNAFTNSAKTLSDTLAKMDENLAKSIQSLQDAMVTMIKDLIDVLLDVPGAAEKAAADANRFLGMINDREVRITFTATGLSDIEARTNQLGQIGGVPTNTSAPFDSTTVSSGGSRGSRDSAYVPQLAQGGIVRARPGGTLVNVGEGGRDEAVIPLNPLGMLPRFASGGIVPGIDMGRDSVLSYLRPGELVIPKAQFEPPALIPRAILQRLNAGMPQSMQSSRTEVNTTTVDNSRKIEPMTVNIYGGRDPFAEEKQMDMMRTKFLASLA